MARQPGEPILNSAPKVIAVYVVTFVVMVLIVMSTTGDSAGARGFTCLAIGVILLVAATYNVRRLSKNRTRP